jgi:hypothetical protein
MWIELGYERDLTATKGIRLTADLFREVVQNFERDRAAYEARGVEFPGVPVTLGHPQDRTVVAVGWIRELRLQNGSLWGRLEASPILADWIDKGVLPTSGWSMGLERDPETGWRLSHVAALPGPAPALPGLRSLNVAFLSKDPGEYIYLARIPSLENLPIAPPDTEWDADAAKRRILEKYGYRGLREFSLYYDESEGKEKDEETGLVKNLNAYKFPVVDIIDGEPHIIPKAVATGLAFIAGARGARVPEDIARAVRPKLERLRERIQKEKEKAEMAETLESQEMTPAEAPPAPTERILLERLEALEAERRRYEAERVELQARLEALEAERRERAVRDFLFGLRRQGRILPAWEGKLLRILLALETRPLRVELSGGDTVDVGAELRAWLESLPVVVPREELVRIELENKTPASALEEAVGRIVRAGGWQAQKEG